MAYRDNVDELCAKLGIPNPISEEDLNVAEANFEFEGQVELPVPLTEMNRAGRLFLQCEADRSRNLIANRAKIIDLTEEIKKRAAEFFTSTLWDDCTRERRALVYGIRHGARVEVVFK